MKIGRPAVVLGLKLAVTLAAVWFILRSVDLHAALGVMKEAAPAALAAAFAMIAGQVAINGVRWSMIAQDADIALRPRAAVRCFWESLFFGQFTPSGIGGDVWRVFAIAGNAPSIASATNSVVVDRIAGAAGLVLTVFAGFSTSPAAGGLIDRASLIAVIAMTVAIAGGVIFLLALKALPELPSRWDRFGLGSQIKKLSALLRNALVSRRVVSAALLMSVAGHLAAASSVWLLARSIGFDPGLFACFLIVPLAVLISMLPITIAGWGIREGVVAAGFYKAGASLDVAAAVSIMFGVELALLGLSGGVALWLSKRFRSGARIGDAAEAGLR